MVRFSLFAFVLLLAGCGFRPLYAVPDGEDGASDQLGALYVESITGSKDARLELEDALRGRVPPADGNEKYAVTIALNDARRGVAVRISSDTQRFDYTLTARVLYRDLETNEVRRQNVRSIVSYGVVDSQYASLVGREDAVRRAAVDLARKIEVDMALFLQDRAPDSDDGALINENPNDNPLFRLEQESLRDFEQ